ASSSSVAHPLMPPSLSPPILAEAEANHPLSLASDSPWTQYHEDAALRQTIRMDVERSFPESAFFRDEAVQAAMTTILLVWCRHAPTASDTAGPPVCAPRAYRQGMHELLGPLYWAVASDARRCDRNDQERHEASLILDPEYIEHDAYTLFEQLMVFVEDWYD
ncbi:RabGAP/TBC, partial [Caulochytrium protostelioides]